MKIISLDDDEIINGYLIQVYLDSLFEDYIGYKRNITIEYYKPINPFGIIKIYEKVIENHNKNFDTYFSLLKDAEKYCPDDSYFRNWKIEKFIIKKENDDS